MADTNKNISIKIKVSQDRLAKFLNRGIPRNSSDYKRIHLHFFLLKHFTTISITFENNQKRFLKICGKFLSNDVQNIPEKMSSWSLSLASLSLLSLSSSPSSLSSSSPSLLSLLPASSVIYVTENLFFKLYLQCTEKRRIDFKLTRWKSYWMVKKVISCEAFRKIATVSKIPWGNPDLRYVIRIYQDYAIVDIFSFVAYIILINDIIIEISW